MPRTHRKIRSVAVVAKLHVDEAGEVVNALAEWLGKRNIRIVVEQLLAREIHREAETFALNKIPTDVDMVLVLGGDGTLLSVARGMRNRQLPILGVNLGSLGFLTNVVVKDLYATLEAILDGRYRVDHRIMLRSTLIRKGEVIAKEVVFNDVVITKGAIARIIEVGVDIDDHFVAVTRADGLIVSTPTGSTAYSLGAGGPILYPSLDAVILTPICPHTLTNRPVVVSDRSEIHLTLRGDPGEVYVTFDGQTSEPMQPGDVVQVRKSRSAVKLIQLENHNFFQVLRNKLHWAARPRARRQTKLKLSPPHPD